jgi:hypothetical protein
MSLVLFLQVQPHHSSSKNDAFAGGQMYAMERSLPVIGIPITPVFSDFFQCVTLIVRQFLWILDRQHGRKLIKVLPAFWHIIPSMMVRRSALRAERLVRPQ